MTRQAIARWALTVGCLAEIGGAWAMKGSTERADLSGSSPATLAGVVDRVDAAGSSIRISGVDYLFSPQRPQGNPAPGRQVRPGDPVQFTVEPDGNRMRIRDLTVKRP